MNELFEALPVQLTPLRDDERRFMRSIPAWPTVGQIDPEDLQVASRLARRRLVKLAWDSNDGLHYAAILPDGRKRLCAGLQLP